MSDIKTSEIKIWGWRQSLIGDSIMALPLLTWAEKQWEGSFKYWQIARKCSQAAPIYINHHLINELVISDCSEGMGPRDFEIAKKCHIKINTMPQHPYGDTEWANERDIYHETALMAGLSTKQYNTLSAEEKRPKLSQWFEVERKPKAIAIWPCAAYGAVQKHQPRYPSFIWSSNLVKRLVKEGYIIFQCGHPNDYFKEGGILDGAIDVRSLPFFEQIKFTLGCDLMIGNDSGSSLVVAAYQTIPQITILTNHIPNHTKNLTALSSNSPLNTSFVGLGNADNVDIEEVIKTVKNLIL